MKTVCENLSGKDGDNNVYRKKGFDFIIIEADNSYMEYSPVYFMVYLKTGKVEYLGGIDFHNVLKLFKE